MKKTKHLAALAACVLALLAVTGCDNGSSEPEPIAVESLTLNVTTLTLAPGKAAKLTATVLPENATDKTVVWSSSDPAVATVGEDGTVTARNKGTATITAHAGGKTATCALTVNKITEKPESIAVESVTLNATTLTLEPGKTMTLTATVTPDNADDKTVRWYASDPSVATVGEDGTVTAVKEGMTTITARAGDKAAECTVTVKQILIAVESVTLDKTTLTLTRGDTGKLTATVTPDNADDKTVLWSSSDASVATVDNDGTVTAHKAGEAKITARAGDIKAECAVTVNPMLFVESVTLDKETLALTRGDTERLTATVTPSNADDTTVTWSSSDVSVATVDNDGTVAAHAEGTATITAKAGDITAACAVTVHAHRIQGGNTCMECGIELGDFEINFQSRLTKYNGHAATVDIPDGVKSIGSNAFNGCTSLASVDISGSVTSIGDSAFYGCTSLASVTIPDSVTSIGEKAFYNCTSLTSMEIPSSVTRIENNAFFGCKALTSVEIPASVTSIGMSAFSACTNLASVTIPDSVTYIGYSAFSACTSLTSVTIPDGVTSIEYSAFSACTSLASVTIPASVTSIEQYAFNGCTSLASMEIPGSVTSIGKYAFYGCTSLASVEIPDGVTSIGESAFEWCTSLASVTYGGTKDDWRNIKKSNGIFYATKVTEITGKDGTFTVNSGGTITE